MRELNRLLLALENGESRTGAAAEAIRALVEAIVLEPDSDQLKIALKADLAGMLNAASDSKSSPDTGDLLVHIKLVAAARNHMICAVEARSLAVLGRPRSRTRCAR